MSTVLITGTTSGFGEIFVQQFVKDGYDLVLVARNQELLDKQRESIKDRKVFCICYDLSKDDASDYILKLLKENNISIDVLVNNVGFDYSEKFVDTPYEKIDGMMKTMVDLTIKLTYGLLPYMLKQNNGMIINLSSVAGRIPLPNNSIYSGAKAFIYMFSNALDMELKDTNVRVSVICPGPTKTKFAKTANLEDSVLFKFNTKSPEPVIKHAYDNANKGKRTIIYGLLNNLQVYLYNVLPKRWFDTLLINMTKISK